MRIDSRTQSLKFLRVPRVSSVLGISKSSFCQPDITRRTILSQCPASSTASLDGCPLNLRSDVLYPHLLKKPKGRFLCFAPCHAEFLRSRFFYCCSLCAFAQSKSRHFELNYSFTVRITDPGKPLDVWFPMAQSDQFQQVKVLSKSGDLKLKETTDPEYGNKMFYAHTDKATQPEYHFTVKYDVVRLEHLAAVSLKQPASDKEPAALFAGRQTGAHYRQACRTRRCPGKAGHV